MDTNLCQQIHVNIQDCIYIWVCPKSKLLRISRLSSFRITHIYEETEAKSVWIERTVMSECRTKFSRAYPRYKQYNTTEDSIRGYNLLFTKSCLPSFLLLRLLLIAPLKIHSHFLNNWSSISNKS